MGGKSETTQQTSQTQHTNPYGFAEPVLKGVLGGVGGINPNPTGVENTAFAGLLGRANAGNPFAGGITNAANSMLTGGPDRTGLAGDAYARFQDQIAPTARGDYLNPNTNPFFGTATSGAVEKSMDELNKRYAAAGISPTSAGSYGQRLGQTVTDTLAPYFMNQYNQERTNQLGAIQGMYGAGNQTAGLLSNLDAQQARTMGAGINASDAAMTANNWGDLTALNVEAQRRGIPLQVLAQQMGIALPAAQAFGTTTSTGTTNATGQMSGAEQFKAIAGGLGSILPKVSFTGTI